MLEPQCCGCRLLKALDLCFSFAYSWVGDTTAQQVSHHYSTSPATGLIGSTYFSLPVPAVRSLCLLLEHSIVRRTATHPTLRVSTQLSTTAITRHQKHLLACATQQDHFASRPGQAGAIRRSRPRSGKRIASNSTPSHGSDGRRVGIRQARADLGRSLPSEARTM